MQHAQEQKLRSPGYRLALLMVLDTQIAEAPALIHAEGAGECLI